MIEEKIAKQIISLSPDPIVILSPKGIIEVANDAAKKTFNTKKLTGTSVLTAKWITKKSKEQIKRDIQKSIKSKGKEKSFEVEVIDKKGQIKILEQKSRKIKEKGELKGWVVILRDKTKEREYIKKIEETKSNLEILIKTSVNPIAVFDKNGKLILINESAARISKRSATEAVGKSLKELVPGKGKEFLKRIKKIFVEKEGRNYEDIVEFQKGKKMHFKTNFKPLKNQRGKIYAVQITGVDITESIQSEEMIKSERDKANTYLNSAEVMLIALDRSGRISLLNKKGYKILGHEEGSLTGKDWFTNCIPIRDRKKIKKYFYEIINKKTKEIELGKNENPIVRKDGKERLIRWSNKLLKNKKGESIGLISSGEDITEIKEQERRYKELFTNMTNGFAYHKILKNKKDVPIDYVFLEINEAFEEMTGLKREKILNKRITKVIPNITKDTTKWIERYGEVATEQKPQKFESYSEALKKWYSISAYSPKKDHFVTIFEDITEKREQEDKVQKSIDELNKFNKFAIGRELKMIQLKKEIKRQKKRVKDDK